MLTREFPEGLEELTGNQSPQVVKTYSFQVSQSVSLVHPP